MKKSKRRARPEKKPLKRVDLHKHPKQGDRPMAEGTQPHPGAGGPWHPFVYVPMVVHPHAGGGGGFSMGAQQAGPFRGVRPRSYARSDGRILEDVCDLLTLHGELDVRGVDVHCRNGVIRLEGVVPDERTRTLVADVAREVLGVESVENHLEVGAAD